MFVSHLAVITTSVNGVTTDTVVEEMEEDTVEEGIPILSKSTKLWRS